ncbi:DNA-binding transcriptional LysR family regulator [Nocardioides luteus]|uniref:LysR family transcriptional regulator n=1 Tax=Nocardioides luteus TaxID=1844 RepID=A0ABQ5SVI5_9ACTN|nr:LysR family transcriptional regulator [Nocardioides luteus]MDR7309465.1 DNA-binding transcriptional LysR family regulator [Nocardioides luteus]GGR51400.1 LysR family transcriptional regulator [Nocardioides luteus]GLJ67871.1 LysR family transcriptional regulator [Nocardioides luteus]
MIDQRLQVLRMVAERGTVSAAATDLGYTPSAISHQLRTLARDVGAQLLVPDGRGVRLTGAALTLLERSHGLFAQWEEIRADVQQASGAARGYLRLAGFSTAASALLPPAAVAVDRRFPQSTIKIIEADPEVCFDMLLADQVDVAVVVSTSDLPPTADPRFEQERLMEDALDLLVPADSPLAGRSRVRLADAAEEHWIMEHPGRPYHQLVTSACAAAGFTPEHAHEVVEWDTGAALVSAGFGVALVPRLARIPHADNLVRIPLRGEASPVRHVRTSVRSGTSRQPEIACALTELRRIAASLADPDKG